MNYRTESSCIFARKQFLSPTLCIHTDSSYILPTFVFKQFNELHLDGTALDMVHVDDAFDKIAFPDASQAQWKSLKMKIESYKEEQQQLKKEEERAR